MDGTDGPPRPGGHRDLLRAARRDRGWSQGAAARELASLATRRGGVAPAPGSLKTQLSRWENGHATPSPEHRALLAELYGRTEADLGLRPPDPPADTAGTAGTAAADRLRAAVGAAAALDDEALDLLAGQVRATAGLDHRLGTAATHATLAAQVEHLRTLLGHCLDPARSRTLASLLAEAAALAGDQERDRDAPDRAWTAYGVAAEAARRAGRTDLDGPLRARRARLLREVGLDAADPAGPGATDRQSPPVTLVVDVGHGPAVRDRLDDLLAEAAAAHRDGRAEEAATAGARARRLALRTGSVRGLAVLDGRDGADAARTHP